MMFRLLTLLIYGLVLATVADVSRAGNSVFTSGANKVISQDETERFEQTYPLNFDGKVSVSNVSGSITIETWDKPLVKLEVVKTAGSREKLAEVEIKIDARPEHFKVETDYGSWKNQRIWSRFGGSEVDYRLIVPQKAALDEIEIVNGSISITDAGNLTKASAVNGQIKAINLRGTVNLSTVNGSIVAEFDKLQKESRIALNTVNGQIVLTIPSDTNATVKATTVNGTIVNDFNLPVRKGQYYGRDLTGKIGNGEVQIRLSSVNGELSVRRKKDGKTLNPVTNLLPENKQENGVSSNPTKPGKQVSEALREAQKRLAEVQPMIESITRNALQQAAQIAEQVTTDLMKNKTLREKLKAATTAEENFVVGSSIVEKSSESFPVKDQPKVVIEAQNCEIRVRGWGKPEVKYEITRISKIPTEKKPDLKTERKDSEISIRVVNPKGNNDALNRVRVEVFVPEKSHVKIHTNGGVRLENVAGEISIEGDQQTIDVRNCGGKLRVVNTNGRVRVIGFKGEIEAQTINGEVSLEGDFTKISGQATDGTFVLTLPENTDVDIETNAEKILVENMPEPQKINEKVWRFGNGNLKYNLAVGNGKILVRNVNSLTARF